MGKEADLAAKVVKYLKEERWDIYQEVQCGGPIADIVAVRKTREGGTLLGVVECKTSLSLELLGQAYNWKKFANWVWVAYPQPKVVHSSFGTTVAKHYGIGILEVGNYEVQEKKAPQLVRKINPQLMKALRPEHQEGFAKAGSNEGGHYTDFKGTCHRLREVVRQHPGIPLKDALIKAQHHYSRTSVALVCMAKYIKDGIVVGVQERRDGKQVLLFPTTP